MAASNPVKPSAARERAATARRGNYASAFTLPPAEQVRTFADMRSLYPTRNIARGERVRELSAGPPLDVRYAVDGQSLGIADFMQRGRTAGLLILHRGRVVQERYALGHAPDTRWISFSMAKSITSILVGAALQDGLIGSLDEPVTRTVPQLLGRAYDRVTLRQVLQMSSGVRWIETYLDPQSDRRKMLELQVREQPGLVIDYLRTLARVAEPGTRFNYNTAETFLLGAILRGAIARPLCAYLSEKIWRPCGMQSDAYWQLESEGGQEFAGTGLSATLRDYARLAAFVLADGVVDGVRVLPEGWVAQSTQVEAASIRAPGKLAGFEPLGYGYQWWIFPTTFGRRVFGALGIFGQQIYIDPDEQLIIVLHSAWPEPVHEPSRSESYVFFQAVAHAVHALGR
jgi:CubicO group peptidase (beta-lactamase class C family)